MPSEQDKRPADDCSEETPSRRPKRGKYALVACDECKRRKLKCLHEEDQDEDHCQRCALEGVECRYSGNRRHVSKALYGKRQVASLSSDVKQLRSLVGSLMDTVGGLQKRLDAGVDTAAPARAVPCTPASITAQSLRRISVPEQPGFVGPTRGAYSIEVGEQSLNDMGIPCFDEPVASASQSPRESSPTRLDSAFWGRCDAAEVVRLVNVFVEEVVSVYPCIDTDYLTAAAADVLGWGRAEAASEPFQGRTLDFKDFQLAKVAIATAVVIESHGKNENSTLMVESVERNVSRILKPKCDMKDLQLLAILSIYYFHSDEDLLAWRTIGLAAREALILGLHRKPALLEAYRDENQRALATRVFWTIYVLDRRWSFGTSLSFALVDRDIDQELPEPGPDYQYLQCMLGYGRLCSKLWDAIMSAGALPDYIPEETAAALDMNMQEWLESIPMDLQLRHPRLGLAARAQPRVLQRLRALLYLRGNHTRILIYRHHLLNPLRIKSNLGKAWLTVDIARDSIEVLVHLHATSDIYSRQQSAFNYFLFSAIGVVFLAVCHDPATFAAPLRQAFVSAVKLIRDFSRHSQASHRLWAVLRRLLPRLRSLGLNSSEGTESANDAPDSRQMPNFAQGGGVSDMSLASQFASQAAFDLDQVATGLGLDMPMQTDLDFQATPDFVEMSHDMMSLFDHFVEGVQFPHALGGGP